MQKILKGVASVEWQAQIGWGATNTNGRFQEIKSARLGRSNLCKLVHE